MSTPLNPLTEHILALRGQKSYGLIAKELGISRNAVAGVCWRSDWPKEKRVRDPSGTSKKNRSGTGRKGGSNHHAEETLHGTYRNDRTL